ncbi:hypothetical protein BJD55_gp018 [Gordonia phage Yvonnetastic]|uniref:Uncharacterized protein n=1 Tax=Gordonia phage Yvonnetastic TaxID=1821566 RepID=A0A142K8Y4_9CAUD|nr:hypothetical protein BJD55_gp018 [Gordonia phage Yvonnetastic]AMS02567.1 hypothetical protein SEA_YVONNETASTIC_18 [Gordonia phage Yvonnetastic]
MTYTAADLDSFVEDRYSTDDWSEFREDADNTREVVKNPDVIPPDHIVDEDGWLRGPEEETSYGRPYRPIVYRDLEHPGVAVPGIGQVTMEEAHGGEGQGDEYWAVFKVAGFDGSVRYFKRDGWYASYEGGSLDGPTLEVAPGEKVIRVWNGIS